jgi:hypothetical protein
MSKLFESLNISPSIRTKSFELNGHTFKVIVPLSNELDAIVDRIANINKETVEDRLKKMTSAFADTKIEGVEIKDDDVIVEGKSTKEIVVSVLQMENRVTEYFKLLVPKTGSLENITYEEINSEFPLQVQLELVEKINEAIQPGYKDARKN